MRWIFLLIVFSTLSACVKDPYNASPVDPRLPELSSVGENTAGAYIDGIAWLSEDPRFRYLPQLTICTRSDMVGTRILISNGYQIVDDTLAMREVGFFLGDISIKQYDQLLDLKNSLITLDGITNYGILILGNATSDTLKFGSGKLYIRDMLSEPAIDAVVFSGTFGFDIEEDGFHHTVYSGRFDFRVKDYNYCFYQ